MEGNAIEDKEKHFDKGEVDRLKVEVDSLTFQVKKLEEENYAKNLQMAGQRQLIETLQEKLVGFKGVKEEKIVKSSEELKWEQSCKELQNKCMLLEAINEEVKAKAQKDGVIWEAETENARKNARKLEEEVYLYKKTIGELEGIDIKYKKEVAEKEKLLKSLDELTKENRLLQETLEKANHSVLNLTEITENNKKVIDSYEDVNQLKKDLVTAEAEVEKIKEMKLTMEKELESLKMINDSLSIQYEELKKSILLLESHNFSLKKSLEEKGKEYDARLSEIEELKLYIASKASELISFKINIQPEKIPENLHQLEDAIKDLTAQNSMLQQGLKKSSIENIKLSETCEKYANDLSSSNENLSSIKSSHDQEIKALNNLLSHEKSLTSELETQLKSLSLSLKDFESKSIKLSKDLDLKSSKLAILEEDISSYTSVISQLNTDKLSLENQLKQKDSKFKTVSSKLLFLEGQLQEKGKEIMAKETELMNVSRTIELLKKKINSSTSRIKQIASEQIDTQNKKIENYENENKLLKEMMKSMQSELKYKQQEILKIKRTSPKKKDPFEESPRLPVKNKRIPESDVKFHADPFKDSPFKKHSMNIFKARSPFKIGSKKNLTSDETPALLRHIIKGYLTSYVLCEQEKKELLKGFTDEDYSRKGILDKKTVLRKCEEVVLDTSMLDMYGEDVDYKDFLEMHYHNQIQHVHRDLDTNFSQVLPGSISISELKLIKQALRPLHRQIWSVIVDRIIAEYPKEVDLQIVKQVLSQATISL